ncbi:MAG: hypothetical protein IIA81_01780 [Thaumarchaeota archaeon]|nr:hypothetical protein [Nitrososphaerota archaeon]
MAKKIPVFERERVIDKRLGIRLKSVYWPLDRIVITDILTQLNYKNMAASSIGSINATKQNTEFYTDYSKLVFGFHNPRVTNLIEAQKEFFSVSNRDFKTNLEKFVRFYEVDCMSNYISDKNAILSISAASEDSRIQKDFEEIIGRPLQTSRLHFTAKGDNDRLDDWLSIDIQPRYESVGNTYSCRMLSRGQNIDALYKLLRGSSEIFEKLITKIES